MVGDVVDDRAEDLVQDVFAVGRNQNQIRAYLGCDSENDLVGAAHADMNDRRNG